MRKHNRGVKHALSHRVMTSLLFCDTDRRSSGATSNLATIVPGTPARISMAVTKTYTICAGALLLSAHCAPRQGGSPDEPFRQRLATGPGVTSSYNGIEQH